MKPEVHHGKWDGGKGSTPRQTNYDKYSENYDKIFGKKNTKKPDPSLYKQVSWVDEDYIDNPVN